MNAQYLTKFATKTKKLSQLTVSCLIVDPSWFEDTKNRTKETVPDPSWTILAKINSCRIVQAVHNTNYHDKKFKPHIHDANIQNISPCCR